MGRLTSELIASVFKGSGIKASALPVYDQEVLKTGRANTSCKECLPLILTTGGLINHLKNRQETDENLVYFMPTCGGNCRFTQYNVFLRKYIQDNKIENVALLSLTNENGYAGLKTSDALNVLKSIIITDCMEDIKNALLVLACDSNQAIETFEKQWEKLLELFSSGNSKKLYKILNQIAEELADIPLKYPLSQAKVVSLMGEIFVRRDYFSCKDIISKLAVRDIIVRRAPVLEWLMYCDFNVDKGIYEAKFNVKEYLQFRTKTILQKTYEKKIKKILSKSGLYHYEPIDIDKTMKYGNNFFDLRLTGEAILVAGAFFKDILHSMHGAISIGPFACMPTRVIESVMSSEATVENRDVLAGEKEKYKNITTLPFLSIETDGSPFPQIVDARLEAFCLQVERVHKLVNENAESKKSDTQQIQGQYSKISIRSDTAKVI
jgi:predicted nucleotide-binding protein (sugar kinase/HSP70/actin superfamily)